MEGLKCAKCGSIPKGPGTLQKVPISIIISWEGSRFPLWANSVWGGREPETPGERVITTVQTPVIRRKDRPRGQPGTLQGERAFPVSTGLWISSSKCRNASSGSKVSSSSKCRNASSGSKVKRGPWAGGRLPCMCGLQTAPWRVFGLTGTGTE